jgi:hypothetical protein
MSEYCKVSDADLCRRLRTDSDSVRAAERIEALTAERDRLAEKVARLEEILREDEMTADELLGTYQTVAAARKDGVK